MTTDLLIAGASRRTMVAPLLAAPMIVASGAVSTLALTFLCPVAAELDAVIALRQSLTNSDSDQAWAVWERRWDAVLVRVEALPQTAEAARVRASAITEIHEGSQPFEAEDTTDYRLARQIIQSLAAGGRN